MKYIKEIANLYKEEIVSVTITVVVFIILIVLFSVFG